MVGVGDATGSHRRCTEGALHFPIADEQGDSRHIPVSHCGAYFASVGSTGCADMYWRGELLDFMKDGKRMNEYTHDHF
jgi:hypothetical protein